MPKKKHDGLEKALRILSELTGRKVKDLKRHPRKAYEAVAEALARDFGKKRAKEMAFHLADLSTDAAFVTALLLFPERFSRREIEDGFYQFVVHVPYHVIHIGRLSGIADLDVSADD
jgi:hypothetical protein